MLSDDWCEEGDKFAAGESWLDECSSHAGDLEGRKSTPGVGNGTGTQQTCWRFRHARAKVLPPLQD